MPILSPLSFLAQADATVAAVETTTSTAAPTAPPTPPKREGGLFDPSMLVMVLVVFLAATFLLQRPEKKRAAERLAALEGMKRGDRVVSNAGIHGVVSKVNKDKGTIFVTVAKDVDLEFSKSVLTMYEEPKEDVKSEGKDLADDPKRLEEPRKKVKA